MEALEYDKKLQDFGWVDYTYEPLTKFDLDPLNFRFTIEDLMKTHMYIASRAEIMAKAVGLGLHNSPKTDWEAMNHRALRNLDRFMYFYRNDVEMSL